MVFRDASTMADDRFELRLAQESSAIRQEIAALRADMATRTDVETLRQQMTAGFSRLERQITESRVDVIKWAFLFWTGQCFVIIGFLLVFLRNR
jgi:hypothetical protein